MSFMSKHDTMVTIVLRSTVFSISVITVIIFIITRLITLQSPPHGERWTGKKNKDDQAGEDGREWAEDFRIPEAQGAAHTRKLA